VNSRGQFSIIAALLVAVVLIAAVITTYSAIRYSPLQGQPQVLSAIDETNLALKQILGFTVGYYGSVLQVTGNSSYARTLATNYLSSGLDNIADIRPEWGPSFNATTLALSTNWFTNTSYSTGNITVKYDLTGLGVYGISYSTSSRLDVIVSNSNSTSQARLTILKDEGEPLINLGQQNFEFYRYIYANATWELINPTNITSYADGTYLIDLPSEVPGDSYVLQVEDSRGIIVTASSFSRYTATLTWDGNYSTIPNENIVIELLQNGTMRWLGQNLNLTQTTKPIPPVPVKAIHVNQTINGANQEVPFQIEDWASEYQVPLGLTNNNSLISSKNMIVFLANSQVSKVTIWWNGSDDATQTPNAYTNRYFAQDDTANGALSNGNLKLILNSSAYLYVDGFDSTSTSWTESGASPYLNDDQNNYINHNQNNGKERWFTFQNLTTAFSQLFASSNQWIGAGVSIDFDCRRDGSDDYFEFRVSDGTTTYGPFSITPGGSYDWRSYDVSNIINTTQKLDNAKIEVTYRQSGGSASNVYIRRSRVSLNFWLTSVNGNSTEKADFMGINTKTPTYGSNLAYPIYNGVVRDIIHQEAEWSNGIANSPNVYSQIVLTLPANVTYYTYQLRLMFINSTQSRTITELCPISLSSSSTNQLQTENGTLNGLPLTVNTTSGYNSFYNFSDGTWAHHWSQFISGTGTGGGIMFTDVANQKLYAFDAIAGNRTGALNVTSGASSGKIELLPVTRYPASFDYALDVTWYGAVATFDSTRTPIYKMQGSTPTGLWITVEYPPTIKVTAET